MGKEKGGKICMLQEKFLSLHRHCEKALAIRVSFPRGSKTISTLLHLNKEPYGSLFVISFCKSVEKHFVFQGVWRDNDYLSSLKNHNFYSQRI